MSAMSDEDGHEQVGFSQRSAVLMRNALELGAAPNRVVAYSPGPNRTQEGVQL